MIVRDLRLHHALFKGNLRTLVCQEEGGKVRFVWGDSDRVDADASYLAADAATYEILGTVRGGRHFFKPGTGIMLGTRLLLVPMATA